MFLIFSEPRSQYECIRLCMLRRSYEHNNRSCINNYNLVTSSWLEHLFSSSSRKNDQPSFSNAALEPNFRSLHFCTHQSDRSFALHIHNRRACLEHCNQPDCISETYTFVTESSGHLNNWLENKTNILNSTRIQIWPDKKMYEVVQHYKEIDVYQLIGALG